MVSQKNNKLKNSIVLKGMASNVVDEAIVILKPNVKIKNFENSTNFRLKEKTISKELIVKEAENVINEYVGKVQKDISIRKFQKLERKIKILRLTNVMFFLIMIIQIINSV